MCWRFVRSRLKGHQAWSLIGKYETKLLFQVLFLYSPHRWETASNNRMQQVTARWYLVPLNPFSYLWYLGFPLLPFTLYQMKSIMAFHCLASPPLKGLLCNGQIYPAEGQLHDYKIWFWITQHHSGFLPSCLKKIIFYKENINLASLKKRHLKGNHKS